MDNSSQTAAEQDEIIIKCDLEKMAKAFFKDYEIVWHDPSVNSKENQQFLTRLETICRVKAFKDWKEAEDYIKAAKTICHVITSGTNGEILVKEIFSSQNVPKILTFCRNEEYHSSWAKNYHQKVLCTETNIECVIAHIQKNLLEWQKQTSSLKFDLPAFAPAFDDRDKSQMNHLHLYLKVIPQFENWKQAKEDFVTLSKRVYSDQQYEKLISIFDQTYNEYNKEAILRWYTKQSFLYKVINNCLRIATSDSIQWSRLLLKDIERAIRDQYNTTSKNFSGLLYRAAYLSEKEWSSLKDNQNREVEMLGFLSASKEKKVAQKFMELDPTKKVFITIIVPKIPIEEEQGFAEIDEFSKFQKEKEVLFNVRSRFTVLETQDEHSKNWPYRHLVLLYGAQSLRKYIAQENPVQKISIQDIGNILCYHCQVPTDKMPEELLFISIVNLEKRICYCKKCLDDTSAPFICVPVAEKVLTIQIKGCLLMNSSQTKLPFYGYKCSQCGVKNQTRYFVCTDCSENKMRWCANCFGGPLGCIKMGHSILLESSPFSFWCEKMPENEFIHLKFQESLVTETSERFRQAEMFRETHEYEKAIEYYEVYIEQNSAKGSSRGLATSYNQVGLIYWEQGKFQMALEYYLKSLNIKNSIYEENHPVIATSYNNIGAAYRSQGEYKTALEYLFKSLKIYILAYGENDPDVATSYTNIGHIYKSQGEYKKALEYHLKSLNIQKSVHGESHPRVATSYNNIGQSYKDQGEYKTALEYDLKSLKISMLVYGENHPSVATSYNNIGWNYRNLGEYKLALEYHLKSLNIQISVYEENHPVVAASYNNIGLIYHNQGEHEMALYYHLKSLDIRKLVHGENHPDIAISYNNIGLVYRDQGDYKMAFEHLFKSLDMRKSLLEENHPHVLISYSNIGSTYENLNEHKQALEYYSKSLNICISVYGESSPQTATLRDKIHQLTSFVPECHT